MRFSAKVRRHRRGPCNWGAKLPGASGRRRICECEPVDGANPCGCTSHPHLRVSSDRALFAWLAMQQIGHLGCHRPVLCSAGFLMAERRRLIEALAPCRASAEAKRPIGLYGHPVQQNCIVRVIANLLPPHSACSWFMHRIVKDIHSTVDNVLVVELLLACIATLYKVNRPRYAAVWRPTSIESFRQVPLGITNVAASPLRAGHCEWSGRRRSSARSA
jgi:hypothetical protein